MVGEGKGAGGTFSNETICFVREWDKESSEYLEMLNSCVITHWEYEEKLVSNSNDSCLVLCVEVFNADGKFIVG